MSVSQDYFLVLFQQKANILSIEAARRVSGAILLGLDGVMSEAQMNTFMRIVPNTTMPSLKFYHRVPKKPSRYDLKTFLNRIVIQLNLTSTTEAKQYIIGFFQAVGIMIGKDQKRQLSRVLPPQLFALLD